MRSISRVLIYSFATLALSAAVPAEAACRGITGTADGFNKADAVAGAQAAVRDAVAELKAKQRLGAVTVSARRPNPQPYWRAAVTADLFFKPDVVTAQTHTVCWRGVVSPVVCSAGARVCW
jgi:hypothetical protein